MNSIQIDPSDLPKDSPLALAARQTSRYFFAAYSKLLAMRWEWSTSVPYGATSGTHLYLNKQGVEEFAGSKDGVGTVAFLLAHEALHGLLGHCWRGMKMSDREVCNIAADYIVNATIDLQNKEIGRRVFVMPKGALLDHSISGDLSLEQLYRKLLNEKRQKQQKQQKQQQKPQPESGTPNPEPSSGDSKPDPSSGDSKPESGGSNEFPGAGKDDLLPPQAEDGKTVEQVIDECEVSNERIIVSDTIDRARQADSGMVGKRLASDRQPFSTVCWKDTLAEWLCKRSREGYNAPFEPSTFIASGLVACGRRGRRCGDIVFVLDTSGSIGRETYTMFLQAAQSCLDEMSPDNLHLLSVSHQVCDAASVQSGDPVPATLKGGGGTRFQPAFDWVKDNVDEPDVLVYLTDGYASDRGSLQPVRYPVLWLSTAVDPTGYPFGDVIEILNK